MLTILIVDDCKDILKLLQEIFRQNKEFDKIFVADTTKEGIELIRNKKIDIVLMDISFDTSKHNIDGILAVREIREFSDITIFMLTSTFGDSAIIDATEAGADDYIPKLNLKDVPNIVLYKNKYEIKKVQRAKNKQIIKDNNFKILTMKQKIIANELLTNLSLEDIAKKLNISYKTVKSHDTEIYKKLNVKNREELITKFL